MDPETNSQIKPINLTTKTIKLIYMNARSVRNKAEDIANFILDESIDILTITETWLKSGDYDKVTLGNLVPKGYKLMHTPRAKRRGGGVGIIIRKNIRSTVQRARHYSAFEHMEALIQSGNECIRLCVIYRPPVSRYTAPTDTFIEQFHEYAEQHVTTNGKIIIVGDFNFHMEDTNNTDAQKFQDLLFSLNLTQYITQVTHEGGHMLDLIITREDESNLLAEIEIHGTGLSDHFPIECIIPWKKPSIPKKKIQYRKWKDIDMDSFIKSIQDSEPINHPSDDLSELVDMYNDTLKTNLEKVAPLITKEVTDRQKCPWYCDEIKLAKQERRKAERRWRKTKLTVHYNILKEKQKYVSQLCSDTKSTYLCNIIQQYETDQRKLYQLANNLLHRKQEISLPIHKSDIELADRFVDFFDDKIKKIRESLSADYPAQNNVIQQQMIPTQRMTSLSTVSEEELLKIIQKGNSKTCGLDPPVEIIPPFLIIIC